jgi:Flp pilus assembly protein TadD
MRSVLVLAAVAASVSFGCESSSSGEASSTTVTAASVSAAPQAPKPPEKKLITITTKSPEAKAALLKALDLDDNGRNEEALGECNKGVAADPNFAFGHTCVGMETPGSAGQAELDKGLQLAAGLPDAERLSIEAFAAARRQETEKYYADRKRVAELAPDDFHAQVWLGWSLLEKHEFGPAEAAYRKALDLNPKASFAYGWLTLIQTQLRKYDDALASAKKYAEGAPSEPGAHQALGGALLQANQTKEALAEMTKAVELGPKARQAYYDLATVKAITGDFAGARETLEKSKVAEVHPEDALDRANNTAWVLFAEGKEADALKLLSETDKDAETKKLPWPGMEDQTRARAMWTLGKPADAMKAADAALAKCDSRAESSELYKGNCHRENLYVRARAQIEAGKLADAKKTVDRLREELKKSSQAAWWQVTTDMLSDQISGIEKKDAKVASALFAKCPPEFSTDELAIVRQAEKDGDKATAELVRKDILGRPVDYIGYPLIARVVKK